jgi:tRNA threonylcarbamoyladenosine biosynthesis protein TsaE
MVKSLEYSTNGPSQTKKIGEILGQEILKTKLKKTAFVTALEGDLGGGKTTFLQGFAKGLGIKQKILSPTFVIVKRFHIPERSEGWRRTNVLGLPCSVFHDFYHIDCYRIRKPKEILDLGFKKIISDPENIIAIEWADRIKKFLPKNALVLKFKFIDKLNRKIVLEFDNG